MAADAPAPIKPAPIKPDLAPVPPDHPGSDRVYHAPPITYRVKNGVTLTINGQRPLWATTNATGAAILRACSGANNVANIADQLAHRFLIAGDEPFVMRDIFKIISHIVVENDLVVLTNGMFVSDKMIERLRVAEPDCDTLKDVTHDMLWALG